MVKSGLETIGEGRRRRLSRDTKWPIASVSNDAIDETHTLIMPYPSIDSDDNDADDIITCISSDDDDDAIAPYFMHDDIVQDKNDMEQDEVDDDNSGELIEVVDDVEFIEETDALDDVNNGEENSSSVFAFQMI